MDQKLNLKNITLYGADTIDVNRLLNVFRICEQYADFGAKKIFTKIDKNYITDSGIQVINTDDINSITDYNYFNQKKLTDFIDTPYVMVVEYDGFILNPKAWTDEFLKYDYIGAPLYVEDRQIVGNGGFSIRSKKLLDLTKNDEAIVLGDKLIHPYAENEDWIISVVKREYLESKGILFAPVELAKSFSLEGSNFNNVWTNEFGFHGLKWTSIHNWLIENPNSKIENPLSPTRTLFSRHSPNKGTVHSLHFDVKDEKTFFDIKYNIKKYEVRAYDFKYEKISEGDTIIFSIPLKGKEVFACPVITISRYVSINDMLEEYNFKDLSPEVKTKEEYISLLESITSYKERIKKGGLFIFKLGEIEML